MEAWAQECIDSHGTSKDAFNDSLSTRSKPKFIQAWMASQEHEQSLITICIYLILHICFLNETWTLRWYYDWARTGWWPCHNFGSQSCTIFHLKSIPLLMLKAPWPVPSTPKPRLRLMFAVSSKSKVTKHSLKQTQHLPGSLTLQTAPHSSSNHPCSGLMLLSVTFWEGNLYMQMQTCNLKEIPPLESINDGLKWKIKVWYPCV